MMELILWRHAEAEDGINDLSRELTAKGRKQAEQTAAFLRQHLPADTRILVSPALRAQQTVAALTDKFTIVPAIAPGASVHAVLQAARWPNGLGAVLLVGHQPTLGSVAATILGSGQESLRIKKSALWWFNRNAGSSDTTLRLVIAPDFL